MRKSILLTGLVLIVSLAVSCQRRAVAPPAVDNDNVTVDSTTANIDEEAGFIDLFDGETLEGWDGNDSFWSVRDGCITGETTAENPTEGNTFLICRTHEVADFELSLKFRIVGGNSGIQYRSREDGEWVIGGYQADFDAVGDWTGSLYEERGRGVLAKRGSRVMIDEQGGLQVLGETTPEADILAAVNTEDWNDYYIVAEGNHLVQMVNRLVAIDVIDNQREKAAKSGLLALQLHAGPPMLVQFKDIRLRELTGPPADSTSAVQDSSTTTFVAGHKKRIVFVAGAPSHGYGAHEHHAGCLLMANYLRKNMDYDCDVIENGYPEDTAVFDGADAIVVYSDGGPRHPLNLHLVEFDELMKQGVGLACFHYAVETVKGPEGDALIDWIGGYFEPDWSVNPHWVAEYTELPTHPITRGVEPFSLEDEWYFHMRFREGMQGVTPILSAFPPESTMSRADGPHSGNPDVRAALQRGESQHTAWAAERPEGGRGFGFTGGHFHWNWGDDNFRKLALNAIVWVAQGEVPQNGVGSSTPGQEELEANQDEPKPEPDTEEATDAEQTQLQEASHDPQDAVASLDLHDELQATLFASEPMLVSPSNIDIDHRGRVWVCDVVNYRQFAGQRPEGDRVLILEDTDGDGLADKDTVFYQGNDINSLHGVCVLGENVIVSAGQNVIVFTDTDGDDVPDARRNLFTGVGSGSQHDHGIHAVVCGPDDRLYFTFGNVGFQIKDGDGNPIVDMAGNEGAASIQPYQQGMVFRCNLDGSELETLGWNFRNNWMATVDSFGTIWQSDNDDDGNASVRINYVMEFGNFGYHDELTGAAWIKERTGMHPDVPYRHWHANDPGVVPNLLHTGAGSPAGISVYEGELLPTVFQGQLIHCDAGPNVTRAYPVADSGAGYSADTVNLVHSTRDKWFRPVGVSVAPDGSLIVADWYDSGVGGHNMTDFDRGRLFRIFPQGSDRSYRAPPYDFATPAGAADALRSPNYAARFLARRALRAMGNDAELELLKLYGDENPRIRARALWLLGRIDGLEQQYVDRALGDDDPNIRIVAVRLARQLKLDLAEIVGRMVGDPSPQVRRECLIALRHFDSDQFPGLWAELAVQHDGHDRWYLEALGIGAGDRWEECFAAWRAKVGEAWNTAAGRDIIWRSRSSAAPELLAAIIMDAATGEEEKSRYFRAFDFHEGPEKDAALRSILGL